MNCPSRVSGLSVLGVVVMMVSLLSLFEFSAVAPMPRHCEGLEVIFYENQNQAFDALMMGEVDMIQRSLSEEQYKTVIEDRYLLLAGYPGRGMYEFDINNNYTLPEYPGVRSVTNEITFRRALAHMVDKDWIINGVLEGLGERVDAHIGAAIMGYANKSVIGANYPYPYNITRAAELLDIYFADTDEDGTRNYPVGWPGRETGPNLDRVRVVIRIEHEARNKAGYALVNNMTALGIPVLILNLGWPWDPITDLDYHIYTGGWSLGRIPTYLYGLYHSSNWGHGTTNYVTGMNSSNLPNYPDLDEVLEKLYFATSLEDFRDAANEATYLLVDYCISIPLWSAKYYMAYSKCLAGVVNGLYTIENTYTFLNVRKLDDPGTPQDESQEPIRMGTAGAPNELNVLYSVWYQDYAVLDRIFAQMLSFPPLDMSKEQPWIAQDFELSTWYDPQDLENKTKVTYWIRQDVFWHAPVTGEAVRQLTAHDVEFTIWYNYIFDDSWYWHSYGGIHHTKIIDDFTIEIYYDSLGIGNFFSLHGPLLPKHEYLNLLCRQVCVPLEVTEPVGPSDKMMLNTTDQVIQMINATKYPEDTPLTEGIDYEVFALNRPNYTHTEIHWLRSLDPGETVEFCYWTNNLTAYGFYLGGLNWNQTFCSIGPYYPVEIVPGVGGYAIFDCNPSHFLGAPMLGEIDWIWHWSGLTKPRSGYYQVNLFDAVVLLKAYGSHGYGFPDPDWCPNADLDSYDVGHIGLLDAVTILVNYGEKCGIPLEP